MKAVFWVSLGVILYTYAGYPLLIALGSQVRPRPWRQAPWPMGEGAAPISVIMAVHNGAAMLPATMERLLRLDEELVREILIVSDGSTDKTAALLREVMDPRVRAIVLEAHQGKAVAVNAGVAAASGEILLFADVRPTIEPEAVRALLRNFADPAVGCVAGELLLRTDGHDATTSAVSGLYWRYEQWIRNCEAAWDSPVGVYGGFYAVRRSLATPAPAGIILDDMFQPLAIIRQGYRSVVDRTAVVVDTWPGQATGEFSRKVRTLAGNFQLVAMAPWVVSTENRVFFQLISHKLLRLAVPWFFALLLGTAAVLGMSGLGWFAGFAVVQAAFWGMAALALRMRVPVLGRVAAPASALLVLNAAAVVGLWKFLFTKGPLWKIWSATAAPKTAAAAAGMASYAPTSRR